jgi:hypothetical protein
MTITTNPPRSRAPRRVSVLFSSLENYSSFWFPTRKGAFVKTSFCTAQAFDKWFFVNPFRSVLVKQTKISKALCAPSPFIDLVEPKPFPAGASASDIGGCCGGPCPCDRPRGDEPHNDNNITGPTC